MKNCKITKILETKNPDYVIVHFIGDDGTADNTVVKTEKGFKVDDSARYFYVKREGGEGYRCVVY